MTTGKKISELEEFPDDELIHPDDLFVCVHFDNPANPVPTPTPSPPSNGVEFQWYDVENSQSYTLDPPKTGEVLQVRNFLKPDNGQSLWDPATWTTVYVTNKNGNHFPGPEEGQGDITHTHRPALAVSSDYSGPTTFMMDQMQISLVLDNAVGYYKLYIQNALYRPADHPGVSLTLTEYNNHWGNLNTPSEIEEPTQLYVTDYLMADDVRTSAGWPAIGRHFVG